MGENYPCEINGEEVFCSDCEHWDGSTCRNAEKLVEEAELKELTEKIQSQYWIGFWAENLTDYPEKK